MAARIMDGKGSAAEIRSELASSVKAHLAAGYSSPCLAAILVGEDAASQVYVRNKQRACEQVGIDSQLHRLADTTSQDELLRLVNDLNHNKQVHGILIQLPLPDQIDATQVLDAVSPLKDVDAFHPANVGLLSQGRPRFLPCTPHGVQQLLHRCEVSIAGKHAVVVGRSDIVGKPMAMLLAARNSTCGPEVANATVTVCHSRTADLAEVTRQADLLIAAIGRPQAITPDMVKPGAVVVDVGINRTADGLVGDVDFAGVREVAAQITPVPGGVGPLTVAMLLFNTLTAAQQQAGNSTH
ncbi:MAG: bifunctional methylenetetrahydrofolate dehydrogenase/methenyltetrahydrofolate cyclohydrolase FolD [Planctomycetaceae bacterium]|nr:bifunctional methylenetetrahydrofolate dehydrogenase/methenyltetrahydrofolate cyclohydrolase FolD [Planctomycetaceae bacterium]